jgi:hypothetical protein
MFNDVDVQRGSQRFTEVHRGSQRFTEVHRGSQRFTEVPPVLTVPVKGRRD